MYRGFFLNLNTNETRRAALTRHLAEIGVSSRYERVEAVNGRDIAHAYDTKLDPGNLGLWLTHESITQTFNSPDLHLHILEDDAILARNIVPVLEGILKGADVQLGNWDLLFTNIFVPAQLHVFQLFSQKMTEHARTKTYSLVDLTHVAFAGTSSLVINKSSVEKYARLLSGNWALGLPIDMYLRQLVHQKQLKAYVVLPFLTSISREFGIGHSRQSGEHSPGDDGFPSVVFSRGGPGSAACGNERVDSRRQSFFNGDALREVAVVYSERQVQALLTKIWVDLGVRAGYYAAPPLSAQVHSLELLMRSIPLLSISIAVVFAATNLASAQEVKWRHDYAAARKEAAETGRPLLLDLGYEGCIWCRKLEATTFRDPAVAKTLNERFVPVKIDIQRDSRIPQALGITGYPTILVASPQGTVLGRQEGFADVAQMTALLNKAPPPAPGEATPAAATAKPEATLTPNRSAAREMLDQARMPRCESLRREPATLPRTHRDVPVIIRSRQRPAFDGSRR